MCFVFIAINGSVSKVPAVALEAKNRIEPAKKPVKLVAKPVDVWRPKNQPAPLHCGGDLVKPLLSREEEDEKSEHYRMRCNASNERKKNSRLTARRRQVVRY